MPVGFGVEGIDVLAVFGQRLRERLALGGEDLVLDPLDVGCAFRLGLPLAGGGVLASLRFLVDQLQRVRRRLAAQQGLLGKRLGQQLRGLGDLRGFRLLGAFKGGSFLVVPAFDGLQLQLQTGFDDGGEALVGLGHLSGGIAHHALCLANRLFDLAQPRLELFQGGVDRFDCPPNRLLRAQAHGFEPFGDFLGGGGSGVHRALGGVRPPGRIGHHLREDAIHLCEPLFVALGRLRNGVGGEDRGEHLPLETQLLDAFHQHLDHEDAGLAHDLKLLGQPRPNLPADQEGTE